MGRKFNFFFITLMNSFPVLFLYSNSFIAITKTIAVCLQCSSIFIQSGLLLLTSDLLKTDWRIILNLCIWQKMFLIFFVAQALVSAFVIGWPSFRNYHVYYMYQHLSFISISNWVWSSQLLWLVSRTLYLRFMLNTSCTSLNTCCFIINDKV